MVETAYSVTDRAQNMTEAEFRNLQGRLHTATVSFTGVSDGAKNYVSIQTGSKPVKIFSASNGSGGFFSRLYEDQGGQDVTFDGTVQDPEPVNREDQSYSFESGFEIQKNPTVTSTGAELVEEYSSGSAGGPSQANTAAPGVIPGKRSLILASDTDYLIEIEDNTSDNDTSIFNIDLNFWEADYNLG